MKKKETRRSALKIIGAIGTTCAFPFSADELYGQHAHATPVLAQIQPAAPFRPAFFKPNEYATISRIADLIVPRTDTPGAVDAGVPRYVDFVVHANAAQRKRFREGLAWLDRAAAKKYRKPFRRLTETEQIEILTPLSDAADRGQIGNPGERFFRAMKNLTADGYYTSRIGLLQELKYPGNTVLASFPECTHPEHHG